MRQRAQRFDPRQHMQSKTFEVFHYRETRHNTVQVHHHDFYEVYCFLGNETEFWVEGRTYRLRSGDLLLINPMEFHRPISIGKDAVYERIVLWINKEYIERLQGNGVSLTRCFDSELPTHTNLLRPSAAQRSLLLARLSELVRESYSTEYAAALCAEGIFLQLMTELNRIALRADARPQTKEDPSSLVSQVAAYLNEHYNEDLSLERLAAQFYVSKYHLSHEFSRTVGTGVYRYLLLKRLFVARQQLSEGGSPAEVCAACGFGDYTAFYRAFKAEYGISPRECAVGQL